VGPQSFRIVREFDGAPARGRYVAGRFLVDPFTRRAVVVDPEGYVESVQAVKGVDRAAATAFVEQTLARCAQSGNLEDLAPLRQVVSDLNRKVHRPDGTSDYDPDLWVTSSELRSLPQQDASASDTARALRRIQAGDDALWEAYISRADIGAFAELEADPAASRFHHSINPVTGEPRSDSDYRRHESRRCLITGAKSGREYTFVPDVPQSVDLSDVAFTPNDQYVVTLIGLPNSAGGLTTAAGYRAAVHRRVAHLETTNPNRDQTFGDVYGQPVVAPQFQLSELNGLVDPTTDWESPDNRFTVPQPNRRPFVVRVRFNQPLDPRTVTPTTFNLTQRRASIGTANERQLQLPVPVDVRLRQSRLGDVEVEVSPRGVTLDPGAEYEITVRNLVRALDGRSNAFDAISSFTTAPLADSFDILFADFARSDTNWVEADVPSPRVLVAADAAHDPDGLGMFVPFLGNDPTPVAAIQTQWIDSHRNAPRYVVRFDNPATPQIIDGMIVHAAPGSSVRVLARTAPGDTGTGQPNLFLVGPWIELDPANFEILGSRFFQMRIEFTVQPGATPATADLPFVERGSVVAYRP
jgi:hypothetical protein